MITTYNTYKYIKESVNKSFINEIYTFLDNIIPKNNNVDIRCVNKYEVKLYWYCETAENGIFTISKYEYYFKLDRYFFKDEYNNFSEATNDIDNLKEYIKNYLEKYYNISNFENEDLIYIPNVNTINYSKYIYELITKDYKKIKEINEIKDFLDKTTLNKIQHLINANKFDLI